MPDGFPIYRLARPLRYRLRIVGEQTVREFDWERWLFFTLERVAAAGASLAWVEAAGCRLTPRSLAALNCWLRSGGLRTFPVREDRDDGAALYSVAEWTRLCRLLSLRFDGRQAAA